MFDTMTLTKVVGGFCGTLLVFLFGGWAAETIYHAGAQGERQQSYVIELEEEGGAEEAAEETVDFAEVMASADPAEGEALWRNCRSCHSLEPGVNGTGPTLYDVVGRAVASVEGFNYSGALREAADVWTPDNLNHFIENPKGFAPGTAMSYAGMRRIDDRANLIAYLDSVDD